MLIVVLAIIALVSMIVAGVLGYLLYDCKKKEKFTETVDEQDDHEQTSSQTADYAQTLTTLY